MGIHKMSEKNGAAKYPEPTEPGDVLSIIKHNICINHCNDDNSSNCVNTDTNNHCCGNSSSSSDEESKQTSSDDRKRKAGAPPDGGFGWVVVASSFFICVLVDGVCFSFGIFFDEFRKEFGTSKSTTSWIGSVLNGTYMIVGPLVSALVNVYGCRRVTICGAIMAFIAFLVSTLSTNIGLLIFTYGFLGGVGFGLMYLPAIVMVGYYFERRRALATGIACCGSGIGAFLFAPLCEFLLEEYGWRGATWVLSAMVCNGVVFALFYRPLSAGSDEDDDDDDAERDIFQLQDTDRGQSMGAPDTGKSRVNAWNTVTVSPPAKRVRSMTVNVDNFPLEYGSSEFPNPEVVRLAYSQDLALLSPHTASALRVRGGGSSHNHPSLLPLQRKDIFYSGSLWQLKEYKELGSVEEFRREMSSKASDLSLEAKDTRGGNLCRALTANFDVTILTSPTFFIYGLSCFLCMMGFFVPFMYMPTLAIDLGLGSQRAAFLISIIGVANIVGRAGVGFITDMPWADCLLMNNVALIVGGVATVFVPFYPYYSVLAVYSSVFGLSIAVFVSLRSIIMVELMGLEKLTTAFGFVIMCQGMSSLIGSPIAGALSDFTGNYNWAFYLAGITLTLSGIICLPLRRVARWEGLQVGRPQDIKIKDNQTDESSDGRTPLGDHVV